MRRSEGGPIRLVVQQKNDAVLIDPTAFGGAVVFDANCQILRRGDQEGYYGDYASGNTISWPFINDGGFFNMAVSGDTARGSWRRTGIFSFTFEVRRRR